MKERVIVDIDGVLCNMQPKLTTFVNEETDLKLSVKSITRELMESKGTSYEEATKRFLNNPTLVFACPPYKRALEGIKILKDSGAKIHVISSRKELLHQVTHDWLEKHGFAQFIDEIHPRSSEFKGYEFKLYIAQKIGSKAAFDDTAEVIEKFTQNGIFVYVIDQLWNRDIDIVSNFKRFKSFFNASLNYSKTHA